MAATAFPLQTSTPEYQLALGARLVAAFEQEPAAQAILRRVLCLGNVPDDLPATMLAWMRNFPSLHALREELSRGQSQGGPVPPIAVALGPLLAWASRQEWANEISWQELLTATRRRLGCCPPPESVDAMVYALRVFQPMFSTLAPEHRAIVLDTWLEPSALWQLHRWTKKDIYTEMAKAWVSLGLLAEQTPQRSGSPAAPSPLLRWCAMVKKTLYAIMPHEQRHMILVLLDSPLSDKAKALAACAGDTEGLDDPELVRLLAPCLDPDEAVRIGQLAWASPVGSTRKSGSSHTYMLHEAVQVNTRMVQAFCPTLYGMLACVVPNNAWAEKHSIAEHVAAFLAPAAQDVLALPMDLGLEEEVPS